MAVEKQTLQTRNTGANMLLNNKQKLEDILYRLQKGEDITQQDAEFITEFSKRMNKINPNFEIIEFVEVINNDSN